jgi:hypothetical protein
MAEPNLQKPGDIPKDPFPIPARPTQPPELTPSDPVNIPPPGQDVILPTNEPVGIPPPRAAVLRVEKTSSAIQSNDQCDLVA